MGKTLKSNNHIHVTGPGGEPIKAFDDTKLDMEEYFGEEYDEEYLPFQEEEEGKSRT